MERRHRALVSYARADDQHHNTFLTQFRERLSNEVRIHTGKEFPIFQDTEDVRWGQYFHERIEGSFQAITFFIPILTPNYFKSTYCRDELRKFLRHEAQCEYGNLVIPVYYIHCNILDDRFQKMSDELAQMISEHECVDWRGLADKSFDTLEVHHMVEHLALRIQHVINPTPVSSLLPSTAPTLLPEETGDKQLPTRNPKNHPDLLIETPDAPTHIPSEQHVQREAGLDDSLSHANTNGQNHHHPLLIVPTLHPTEYPSMSDSPMSPSPSTAPLPSERKEPMPVSPPLSSKPVEFVRFQGMFQQTTDTIIHTIAFGHNTNILALGGRDNIVRVWDLSSGREIQRFEGHTGHVVSVAFAPNNDAIASGSRDKTIRLWDLSTGKETQRFDKHTARITNIAFSPNGRYIASSSEDKTARLWDVARGREVRRMEGHTRAVSDVAFSPDGLLLATGGEDNTVRIWEVLSGKEVQRLQGHKDYVRCIALSSDGLFVASGSDDQTVRIWEIATGRTVRRLEKHKAGVTSISFSPNGRLLVSGSTDKTVRIWEKAHELEIQENRGTSDKNIRMWELSSEIETIPLKGRKDLIRKVAFCSDGKLLALVTDSQLLRICGLAVPEIEWAHLSQIWNERERQQRQDRRAEGLCEECGVPLSFLDKMIRQKKCKECR